MTWGDVATAGAFAIGVILGAAGTIRLTGYVMNYLRQRDDR